MVNETVQKIKSLQIQGATNVAKAAINELKKTLKTNSRKVNSVAKALMNSRPTEPLMRNGIRYILSGKSNEERIRNANEFMKMIKSAEEKIAEVGANFLQKNIIVYTHCHSSTVTSILKKAKKKIKYVVNTETRPRYQGRITAKELAKAGIKVYHFVDSAVADIANDVDIAIVGADCISSMYFINKVGTLGIAKLMREADTPMYSATTLLKFDPETFYKLEKIEQRDPSEVWKNPPRGVKVQNPAFDIIPNEYVNFITEFGVISPSQIIDVIEKEYPFILEKFL